ncbi:type IVB secretion system protein IcmJDotN [Vibrio owensii]|uniref:type IVB secretion system protein IcmJDotN n=1 Tax=Vibrio harveyi group TaxID=717610 RepID=UPI003CC66C6E
MKDILEVVLSVKRSQFRCDDPSSDESNKEFISIRKEILERDKHSCQYCGFTSMKFQEVHHLDDDHSNNNPSNLVTACPLCHASHHVGFSGVKGRGCLIYIDPTLELTQAELNSIVRTLWIGEFSKDNELQVASTSFLARLYKLSVTAKRQIGTSSASVLGDYLLSLEDKQYAMRSEKLKGVYFLPSKEQFQRQLTFWLNETYKGVPSNTWKTVAEQKLTKWLENEIGDTSQERKIEYLGLQE